MGNSTIEQLRRMREQYQSEGKAGGGSNELLMFRTEDRALGWFLWDGQDSGHDNFRYYIAHEHPPTPGQRFGQTKPCLADLTGGECAGCAAGLKTKARMCMRLYIFGVIHTKLREGEAGQLPLVTMYGATGYWREINGYRLWDTSAWRDSPFDDILNMADQMNLTTMMFQFYASGEEKARRYKVIPIFNVGAADPAALAAAQQVPTVDQWLLSQVQQTVAAPAAVAGAAASQWTGTGAREYAMVDGKLVEIGTGSGTPPPTPPAATAGAAPTPPIAPVAPAAAPMPPAAPVAPAAPAVPATPAMMPESFAPDAQELAEMEAAEATVPIPAAPTPTAKKGKGLF